MGGSFADAFGPACLRFLRPMRVVGAGGGSYLGLSFYRFHKQPHFIGEDVNSANLVFLVFVIARRLIAAQSGLIRSLGCN